MKCIHLLLVLLLVPCTVRANGLTEHQARLAVETWVRSVTADARPNAVIQRMEPHQSDGQTVAYIAHLAGGGYCLCGADEAVLPVYLYSPNGSYDPQNPACQAILQEI
ncbi:MAG TPA: Spi family protease inhibitor, partial [Bacteroidota bacterium]|nr:Spi family protease inhibitor [Bacteroidota bacterium]